MTNYLLFPDGKEKALTLSYDDGVTTDIDFIRMMERYGMKTTFNLCPGLFGPESTKRGPGENLSPDRMKDIYTHPLCEVATHGYHHPRMDLLPPAQLFYELYQSRVELERMFGRLVRGHAYPYGTNSEQTREALKQTGYAYARTTIMHHHFRLPTDFLSWGTTCHHNDPELMTLADRFLTESPQFDDAWCFYIWGHTYEFDQDHNWDLMERLFDRVAGREDIWYATNGEICDYVTAYRSLIYAADGSFVYNPTQVDVWAKINDKRYTLPAGKTVTLE